MPNIGASFQVTVVVDNTTSKLRLRSIAIVITQTLINTKGGSNSTATLGSRSETYIYMASQFWPPFRIIDDLSLLRYLFRSYTTKPGAYTDETSTCLPLPFSFPFSLRWSSLLLPNVNNNSNNPLVSTPWPSNTASTHRKGHTFVWHAQVRCLCSSVSKLSHH